MTEQDWQAIYKTLLVFGIPTAFGLVLYGLDALAVRAQCWWQERQRRSLDW